jgi:hypothetical protein
MLLPSTCARYEKKCMVLLLRRPVVAAYVSGRVIRSLSSFPLWLRQLISNFGDTLRPQ